MPITFNGNGTVTGISVGGLPDGCVDTDTLATSVTRGKILQVQQAVKTDTFITNSQSLVDITGMSVSITPSATNSKVLVLVNYNHSHAQSNRWSLFTLLRDSTQIYLGNASSSRSRASTFTSLIGASGDGVYQQNSHICFLDSPNTTSATTYKMQCETQDSNYLVFNRGGSDDNAEYGGRTASSITVMEVAA